MSQQNINDKSARHKAQALSIIKNQVRIYKKKLTMYGFCCEEVVLCIKKCLGKMVGNNLGKDTKTDDIMNVIQKYMKKKKNKEIDMLIDIITNFDIQINELSSEQEQELCTDKNKVQADILKVQTQQKHSNSDQFKEGQENQLSQCVSQQGESYVKLLPVVWMENSETEKANKKEKRNKRWQLGPII